MADQEIRFRMSVDGGRDVYNNVRQIEQAIAALTQATKRLNLENEAEAQMFRVQQVEIAKLKNLLNDLTKTSLSDTQNAFRGAHAAMFSFSQVIQDAPFGIRGVANNITQLVTQMATMTSATGSAGGALKAMLGTLAGPTGIVLGISVITSLAVAFGDQLLPKVKSADELMKSMVESAKALASSGIAGVDRATASREMGVYQTMIGQAESELSATTTKTRRRTFRGEVIEEQYKVSAMAEADRQALSKQIAVWKQYVDEYRRFLDGLAQAEQEEQRKSGAKYEEAVSSGRIGANIARGGIGVSALRASRLTGGPKSSRLFQVDAGDPVKLTAEFNRADAAFLGLQSSFMAGISAMSSSTSIIGDAFASMFGGARTLLGSFAKAFADTMTQLATKYAIGLLFQSIGGGFFGSLGGSIMQGLGIGEKSGSVAAANAGMMAVGGQGSGLAAEVRGMRRAIESGVWRVKGDDIVFSSSRASQKRLSLQYGV